MRLANCALIAIAFLSAATTWATPPLATRLPETTKGFMSSPDVQLMQEKFDQTEPGKFTNDPIMKPFMDELRKQARDESNPDRIHYGVTWDDVKDVGRGEAC